MAKPSAIPFNIYLLELNEARLKGVRPVTALDIFEGSSSDFHDDGLFSTAIFGRVGDERRNQRFSYIDIKIPILHPIIYNVLTKMKRLYADILSGTGYALWSEEEKDFVKSNAAEGSTGYHYFLQHWKDIDFGVTASSNRDQAVKLIQKYQDRALSRYVVVLPAGLRDVEIDRHNRVSSDEINSLYYRVMTLSNTITEATAKNHPELLNTQRYQLQLAFNAIYEKLSSLIEGKSKLLLGRWASRRIFNGTRNVITAMDTSVNYLGAPGQADFNSTIVGLYQYLKATLPVSVYQVRRFLEPMFPDINQPARLVNKETLESEEILLHSRYYNQWATKEGIERVITALKEEHTRSIPLEIDGRYLALLYRGPDGTFKVLQSINEVIETRNKEDVRPITLAEMLYLAVYKHANKIPALITRYPVTGVGSIYPSRTWLQVTLDYEKRRPLDANWEPMAEEETAYAFPVLTSAFVNSLIPHPSKLGRLGAD